VKRRITAGAERPRGADDAPVTRQGRAEDFLARTEAVREGEAEARARENLRVIVSEKRQLQEEQRALAERKSTRRPSRLASQWGWHELETRIEQLRVREDRAREELQRLLDAKPEQRPLIASE
jgi:hypothetical protein